jgi:hypothetical protein
VVATPQRDRLPLHARVRACLHMHTLTPHTHAHTHTLTHTACTHANLLIHTHTPHRMRYITSINRRTKFNSAVLVTEAVIGSLYLLTGVVGYAALGSGMDLHKWVFIRVCTRVYVCACVCVCV